MRLTNRLFAQHLGWHFKQKWKVQRVRVPHDTGAAKELAKYGITVKDIKDVAKPPRVLVERLEFDTLLPPPPAEDETHPNWHKEPCFLYGNENVLLEGLQQAQVLTNTVAVNNFPSKIEKSIDEMKVSHHVGANIYQAIMASHVYDSERVKLPKVKLPDRPQINLPRVYGISRERRTRLLVNKLIAECEKIAGRSITSRRRILDGINFTVLLRRNEDLFQSNLTIDKLITSEVPLEYVKERYECELPDLHPIKCTISMPQKNIYATNIQYPFSKNIDSSHPHTMVTFFDEEYVGNLHKSPVSSTQFQSRTLMKAFTVAASRAKLLYNDIDGKKLPKPIMVQCIQTDGQMFHFGVFQLNTLALGNELNDHTQNYWFHKTEMKLFGECGYKNGRPYLENYNEEVFPILNAFYLNS